MEISASVTCLVEDKVESCGALPPSCFKRLVQVHLQHGDGKFYKTGATDSWTIAGHKTNSNLRSWGRVIQAGLKSLASVHDGS